MKSFDFVIIHNITISELAMGIAKVLIVRTAQKWSFQLKIFSVNVTKYVVSSQFGYIYRSIIKGKTLFYVLWVKLKLYHHQIKSREIWFYPTDELERNCYKVFLFKYPNSLIVAYDMDKGKAIAETQRAGNSKGDRSQVSCPIFECYS